MSGTLRLIHLRNPHPSARSAAREALPQAVPLPETPLRRRFHPLGLWAEQTALVNGAPVQAQQGGPSQAESLQN
jgi:hypothetical protein